jgi:hypothetical protein
VSILIQVTTSSKSNDFKIVKNTIYFTVTPINYSVIRFECKEDNVFNMCITPEIGASQCNNNYVKLNFEKGNDKNGEYISFTVSPLNTLFGASGVGSIWIVYDK